MTTTMTRSAINYIVRDNSRRQHGNTGVCDRFSIITVRRCLRPRIRPWTRRSKSRPSFIILDYFSIIDDVLQLVETPFPRSKVPRTAPCEQSLSRTRATSRRSEENIKSLYVHVGHVYTRPSVPRRRLLRREFDTAGRERIHNFASIARSFYDGIYTYPSKRVFRTFF